VILVTGASGRIGSEVVRILAGRQHPTRALVRDPSRAPAAATEVAIGDFDEPATLDAAVSGIETLVLVSPSVPAQEIAVIDSAARNGVEHIVKITNHKATSESPVDRRRDHAEIEAHLRESGLNHTLLAPNLLMQNLLAFAPAIRQTRGFAMSAGEGRFGMVDARDVAEAAATVAAEPGDHRDRTYLLTGPELVDYTDVANTFTNVLGTPVEYRRISPEAHRVAMIDAGVPESVAASNAQVFGLIAEGDAEWLSGDLERVTARRPRSLHGFIAEHASAFR
jgi:uncharacterized protein YbjT (DUF2867 family)